MSDDAQSPPLEPDAGQETPILAEALPAETYTPRAGQYYRVDSSKTTFTELWRDAGFPLVIIAWISKLMRVKLPGAINDPNVVSLRPFMVPENEVQSTLPQDVGQKILPVLRELADLAPGRPELWQTHAELHGGRDNAHPSPGGSTDSNRLAEPRTRG